jgi:putative transcriptional regulator
MNKIVTKGPRRLVGDRWHDDNGLIPDHPLDWDPPMTDDEITAAAMSDPDARPLTDEQLSRMRRAGLAGVIRRRLRLSLDEFEARYHVLAGTLVAWERGQATPDSAMLAYLVLIDADPQGVAATLAKQRVPATAAE